MKHSGLGIASFILSIFVGLSEFVLVVVAAIMAAMSDDGMDEESAGVIVLGLLVIGGCLLALVGLVLGIAGLCQQNRKKVFAALGTAFNAMTILIVLGLIAIGIAAG